MSEHAARGGEAAEPIDVARDVAAFILMLGDPTGPPLANLLQSEASFKSTSISNSDFYDLSGRGTRVRLIDHGSDEWPAYQYDLTILGTAGRFVQRQHELRALFNAADGGPDHDPDRSTTSPDVTIGRAWNMLGLRWGVKELSGPEAETALSGLLRSVKRLRRRPETGAGLAAA
jgi:hypothetical protein